MKKRYWVVSPNVSNKISEESLWKKIIMEEHLAFMGWGEDHDFGKKFKDEIQIGDFILIAQGANRQKKLFIGGIVSSEAKWEHYKDTLNPSFQRKLYPYIEKKELESLGLNFEGTAYGAADRIPALYELHPNRNNADKKIIEKIERALILKIQKKEMEDKIELLKYKKQIILQGPPGTGKTRLAKLIAEEISKPSEIDNEDINFYIKVDQKVITSSSSTSFKITKIQDNKLEYIRSSTNKYGSLNFKDILSAYKDRLWEKGNIVNGGDTYRAAIAKFIFNNYKSNLTTIIQFHPSYSYEDFVRGIVTEPNDNGEGVLYKTENKILADLAEKANENYLLSQDNNTDAIQNKWVEDNFAEFKASFEGDNLILSGTISIFKVENDCFRYGKDWGNSSRINFKDFKALIKAVVNKRLNKDENQIPKNISVHAHYRFTYYLALLRIFFKKYEYTLVHNKIILRNYVLIIDEINRANLPSVLGELIYALEYRDEPVESMYEFEGKREIILPSNLYIIGTMNTADRSVGHIDYAIKRRFAFVEVLPTDQAIDDVVKEPNLNLKAKELYKNVAKLFNEDKDKLPVYLQSDFKAKDVQLGHSYFLVETEKQLEMKLEYEIKPLLKEYIKDGILSEEATKEIEAL
jgi:MoxR-like ATPase